MKYTTIGFYELSITEVWEKECISKNLFARNCPITTDFNLSKERITIYDSYPGEVAEKMFEELQVKDLYSGSLYIKGGYVYNRIIFEKSTSDIFTEDPYDKGYEVVFKTKFNHTDKMHLSDGYTIPPSLISIMTKLYKSEYGLKDFTLGTDGRLCYCVFTDNKIGNNFWAEWDLNKEFYSGIDNKIKCHETPILDIYNKYAFLDLVSGINDKCKDSFIILNRQEGKKKIKLAANWHPITIPGTKNKGFDIIDNDFHFLLHVCLCGSFYSMATVFSDRLGECMVMTGNGTDIGYVSMNILDK